MSDALDRIKNRQRPEVAKRDSSMTAASNRSDIDTSRYLDSEASTKLDIDNSRYPDIQISTHLETKQQTSPSLEVKQTTLRLDKQIAVDLQALCQREQICREVAIEAMFLAVTNDPELCERILTEARTRQCKRTSIANHKRAASMLQKFEL